MGLLTELSTRIRPGVLGGRLRQALHPRRALPPKGRAPAPAEGDRFSSIAAKQALQVVLAEGTDLPGLVRLNNQIFSQRLHSLECRLLQMLGEKMYVVRDPQDVSRLMAMVRLKPVRQPAGELTGIIYNLAVAESHRGKGIASALLREVQAQARRQGMTQLVLSAKPGLQPFYEGLGFRRMEGKPSSLWVAQGHWVFSLAL